MPIAKGILTGDPRIPKLVAQIFTIVHESVERELPGLPAFIKDLNFHIAMSQIAAQMINQATSIVSNVMTKDPEDMIRDAIENGNLEGALGRMVKNDREASVELLDSLETAANLSSEKIILRDKLRELLLK